MDLRGIVGLILSEEGQAALARSGMIAGGPAEVLLEALEEDEKGLWVDIWKEDGRHRLLIRWDCILAIDVPIGGTPPLESFVQA
jgi:hypothetical protein